MGPLARPLHSGAPRPALTHDTAPHHGAVQEQRPSWGRSPGRRTPARAARHSCPTVRPVMGPPCSNSHHGAARQDAAFWHEPPGTRLGAALIMGPLARTPHSGPSRLAVAPDYAPHHGAALEQLPSWGRSAIGRTLARAARHSRPPVHPERGGQDQNEEDDAGQIMAPPPQHQRLLWAIGQSSHTSRATRRETLALP